MTNLDRSKVSGIWIFADDFVKFKLPVDWNLLKQRANTLAGLRIKYQRKPNVVFFLHFSQMKLFSYQENTIGLKKLAIYEGIFLSSFISLSKLIDRLLISTWESVTFGCY